MRLHPTSVPDLRVGYTQIVEEVLHNGSPASPRGYRTWEIEDACFQVEDTTRVLPVGVGRGIKPEIGAAESLLLCAGLASPSLLVSASGAFRRFVDGGVLHGAYGPRVRPQMDTVVRRLTSDRDSRQAVVQVWDPLYDQTDTRDLPCTLGFGFRLRDDGLHLSTTMRSQDVILGLAYDGFMFCQLGWTVANVLGVELASWRHHAYSLHVYERNLDLAERLGPTDGETDVTEPLGFRGETYEEARGRAELVYNTTPGAAGPLDQYSADERWYITTLAGCDRLTSKSNFES